MPRNPYQYMGMSGHRGYGQGGNYSYGQQGSNNPYGQAQRGSANYSQSYMNPYQNYTGGGQSTNYPGSGWGDQWSRDPYIPGGHLRQGMGQRMPPPGKGRGSGGISPGMPTMGNVGQSAQRWRQDPNRMDINDPFKLYGALMQQRQMEERLGIGQGAPWMKPQGLSSYQLRHGPFGRLYGGDWGNYADAGFGGF